jgi:hypothetical protein
VLIEAARAFEEAIEDTGHVVTAEDLQCLEDVLVRAREMATARLREK